MPLSQLRNIAILAEHELAHIQRPPIIGRVTPSALAHEFREIKLKLKEKNYPPRLTQRFMKSFLERNKDLFSSYLNPDCIVVPVPSGSGTNLITEMFVQALQKQTGCTRVPPGSVWKTHTYEAKHNLSLEKRLKDPIGYGMDEQVVKQAIGTKRVFILDDLIGSGESAVKLKRELNKAGIPVDGMVNLVTIEKAYPSVNDITRVVGKLADHTQTHESPLLLDLAKDCCILFGDYTRQKLNRVEREIRNFKSALKAIQLISLGATMERAFQNKSEYTNHFKSHVKTVGLHA